MSFGGFGRDSGPNTGPRAQSSFVNFPRAPSPTPPRSVSPGNEHPLNWGVKKAPTFQEHGAQTYQRPPDLLPWATSSNMRDGRSAEVQNMRITNSPYSRSPDAVTNNSRNVIVRPQSPLVHPRNQYVRGQRPHTEGIQQRPSLPHVWGGPLRPPSTNTMPPAQEKLYFISEKGGTNKPGPIFRSNHVDVPLSKQTRSPTPPLSQGLSPESTFFHSPSHKRSLIVYEDLDAPEEMPSASLAIESSFTTRDAASHSFAGSEKAFTSSQMWGSQTKSSGNKTDPLVEENMPSVLTPRSTYQSGKPLSTKNAISPLSKRTRSPTLPSTNEDFPEGPAIDLGGNKRAPDFQRQSQSSTSGQAKRVEVAVDKSMQFPAVKRTKVPLSSSYNQAFQENLDAAQEDERELHAKAKRLARFKDELSQPLQSNSTVKNQNVPAKRQLQSLHEKQNFSENPTIDAMADSSGGNPVPDNEGMVSSGVIVGLCPDMCPESERAERERKGDLDQYERVDGDRNLTSEFLAVKKYNRTAEREAMLIRPMPILWKTMDYLLNLLSEPYDDRFLGLYNFLWDRMRAIRMDLRMQHIFNLEAISMLEQMIRLHIIAMHELCEYTRGEGFSEGFDAHLNIEQMNKTSVELFQLYDDHRKKGVHVPSEHEFRGYYALLKLDKHPGYKVEPAELSLDLAKMTPEIRQTPEVLFARDVARACRTGNFISFFRLANKASYLQACLMHAHFSKLRTQALASLHSGLQINQGIPVVHVAKWLGMQEEDIGELLEYHGFSVKDFEEPYMVKENAFINVDNDFPIKRSKLVHRKRSGTIAGDVSFPSPTESCAAEEVPQIQLKKDPEPTTSIMVSSFAPASTSKVQDEEMHDLGIILSPKSSIQKPKNTTSTVLATPDEISAGHEVWGAPASPFLLNFSHGSADNNQKRVDSPQKPKFESVFRNSFGRSSRQASEAISPITLDTTEEIRYPVSPHNSVVHTPVLQPVSTTIFEDEEETHATEEDESEKVTRSYYDQEVAEAKLRLILRIWKRHTAKKRELREHKQLAASAAMNLLSMGPPMWQFEVPSSNYGVFDIDRAMSERYKIQERSSSVLNPLGVIAAKLAEKNPDAKCLCWKMVVCSAEEIPHGDNIGQWNEAARSWFHSKLMPTNYEGDGDLLVSSPGLAIWSSWIPSSFDADLTCCLVVIKSTQLDDLNKSITGTSAILFLLSNDIPLEHQKNRLHELVASLPSGSQLPLLIMDDSGEGESDVSSIAENLKLDDIDKSRVVGYDITFLKDMDERNMDGFFSDKRLREGLEWLANESLPQIVVSEIKTRELVLSHLNPSLEVLEEMDIHQVSPNTCISVYNEALNRSIKEVTAAVDANPTSWPCPEINLLDQSSNEYRAVACYLPSIGWSSASRTDVLMCALNDSRLPPFEDDLSWLSRGVNIIDNFENQTSCLENCLVSYLTTASQLMGATLADKEARIMLQKSTRLELHGTTYYIVPQWVSIFRRVFNWRLMNLDGGEVSSTYVLQQDYSTLGSNILDYLDSKAFMSLPPYTVNPFFNELVEVGCLPQGLWSNHKELEAFAVWSGDANVPTSNDDVVLMENEEAVKAESPSVSSDASVPTSDNKVTATEAEATEDADKLRELLVKCNIMQNLIDKKLSIYF